MNLEILNINKMASGHLSLDITEKINWEEFATFAEKFIKFFNGSILSKVDGPDIRIWEVDINNHNFRLIFDDYPIMVSLESMDELSDNELKRIRGVLLNLQSNC